MGSWLICSTCFSSLSRIDAAITLGESAGTFIDFDSGATNLAVGAGFNVEGSLSHAGALGYSISLGPMVGKTNTHISSFSGLISDSSCGVAC
ncbi:hypothetical protein [Pseudoalteromonas piscicida]|uniref:hypothetical protein n=1 Tax=Pseudoalteromonas piscicida TaxID=43662 RepID=UPI0030B204CA